MPDDKIKTTVVLPKELRRRAKVRAAAEERDLSEIIAELLADYLKTPIKREGK
jgi:ribosomal protein L1